MGIDCMGTGGNANAKSHSRIFAAQLYEQVAQLSQRDRATHELLRFAKLRSGIFEPPFRDLGET